jgi:hypothetical protein
MLPLPVGITAAREASDPTRLRDAGIQGFVLSEIVIGCSRDPAGSARATGAVARSRRTGAGTVTNQRLVE